MSSPYTQQVLKVIVAQVCQTIGWNSIQTTPLELLGDILHKYLQEVAQQTHRYAELYDRSEPNLDDVALAFRDLHINIADLEEYVTNVDPVPCAIDVPKYPVHKDNHLNHLKPGCKEVVTRPVHVHEHLPPMYPEKEDDEKPNAGETNGDPADDHSDHEAKRSSSDPIDVFSSPEPASSAPSANGTNGDATALLSTPTTQGAAPDGAAGQRVRTLSSHSSLGGGGGDTEVRLTREITSVMMTTSGFISPAREGKLPDAKTPILQQQFDPPPMPKLAALSFPGTGAAAGLLPTSAAAEGTLPTAGTAASATLTPLTSKKKKGSSDKRIAKDLFRSKMAPMGPPPPKQMPSMAEPLYPPSNSPMAAIVQQQQQHQQQIGGALAVAAPGQKPDKKHKHKDGGKAAAAAAAAASADGTSPAPKLSKKKQKKLLAQAQAAAAAAAAASAVVPSAPWDNTRFPGIDPIQPAMPPLLAPFASATTSSTASTSAAPPPQLAPIKSEPRPPTPDAQTPKPASQSQPPPPPPLLVPLQSVPPQLSPISGLLPAGTTGIAMSSAEYCAEAAKIATAKFDKHKQNILKRISTATPLKEETGGRGLLPNLPEMSIFPIMDEPTAALAPGSASSFADMQPLNMSMPKATPPFQMSPQPQLASPTSGVPNLAALSSGFAAQPAHLLGMLSPQQQQLPGSAAKGKREPKPKKVREKKPPKPRAKKSKAGAPGAAAGWPPLSDLSSAQLQLLAQSGAVPPPLSPFAAASDSAAPHPKRTAGAGHLPPTLGNFDLDAFQQFSGALGAAGAAAGGLPGGMPLGMPPRPDFMFPWPFAGAAQAGGLIPLLPPAIGGVPAAVGGAAGPGLIPSAAFYPPFAMPGSAAAAAAAALRPPELVPFGAFGGGPGAAGSPEFPPRTSAKRARLADGGGQPVQCNVAPLLPPSAAAAIIDNEIIDLDDDDDDDEVPAPPAPAKMAEQPATTVTSAPNPEPSNKRRRSPTPPPPPPIAIAAPPAAPAPPAPIEPAPVPAPEPQQPPQPPPSPPPVAAELPQLPKASGPPPIIDLDVQSISDDELPFDDDDDDDDDDDMDLEDMDLEEEQQQQHASNAGPSQSSASLTPLSKKDRSALKLERKREREARKEAARARDGGAAGSGSAKLGKKKKDKKDKTRQRDKSEKRKEKEEKRRDKEAQKERAKREKKEKRRAAAQAESGGGGGADAGADGGAGASGFGGDIGIGNAVSAATAPPRTHPEGAVPKLTLKLGASPRPNTPDAHRKITIKPPKKEHQLLHQHMDSAALDGREPSPEMARFSALVTRPPKQKTPNTSSNSNSNSQTSKRKDDDKPNINTSATNYASDLSSVSSADLSFGKDAVSTTATTPSPSSTLAAPPAAQSSPMPMAAAAAAAAIGGGGQQSLAPPVMGSPATSQQQQQQQPMMHQHPAHRPRPKGCVTLTAAATLGGFGGGTGMMQSMAGGGPMDMAAGGGMSTAMAGGGVAGPPQPRKMNPPDGKAHKAAMKAAARAAGGGDREAAAGSGGSASATGVQDSEGNQVWICPACGRVDDGTPMIGCDGCDAWYHWVCVGIQVAPDTNEDWYCRVCIAKKQEQAAGGGDKKKKRKKKDKKDH